MNGQTPFKNFYGEGLPEVGWLNAALHNYLAEAAL
jgi:hypothetical protein